MTESEPLLNPGAAARSLREMWQHKTGEDLSSTWDTAIISWIKKFGLPLTTDAIQAVADSGYSEDGEFQPPSIHSVPSYAAVEQAEAAEPGMRNCYFVRGRMRKKFYCRDSDDTILTLLTNAMRGGISASDMHRAVDDNDTPEDCFAVLGVNRTEFRIAMGHPIVDLPIKRHVFIREDDPEWPFWDAHLRKTTGRGSPKNKNFGWYFPTRMPPLDEPPKRKSPRAFSETPTPTS